MLLYCWRMKRIKWRLKVQISEHGYVMVFDFVKLVMYTLVPSKQKVEKGYKNVSLITENTIAYKTFESLYQVAMLSLWLKILMIFLSD